MVKAQAQIVRSVNNGPFIYVFEVNGELQNAAVGVTTLNVALDAIKALIGNVAVVPGTIQRVVIGVTTKEG